MQNVDLDALVDSLSIEDLAALRDNAAAKLAEKVAARQKELEEELERLAEYGGKPRKAAAPKAAKEPKVSEPKDSVAKAA